MRLLIISQYHPPEMGAAATRWSDYARILTDIGHAVFVISEVPNYPSGTIPGTYSGGNKFKLTRDSQNKYTILHVPVWANPRKNTIQRMGFFLSFMVSAIYAALKIRRFDAVIVTSPPLFVGVVGVVLRWAKRNEVILDVRDLWPESAIILGELKNRIAIYWGKRLEKLVYHTVNKFLFAVPGFKSHFGQYRLRSELKSFPLMNGIDQTFFNEAGQKKPQRVLSAFTVVYAGNFGLAQNLEIILGAAKKLASRPIKFLLVGAGARRDVLTAWVENEKLSNVEIRPPVPREALITILRSAHIGIVPLIDSQLFLHAIPSKLLEYMACELPCIVSIKGEIEEIIAASGGGVCIQPEDHDALAQQILELTNDEHRRNEMGRKGREYVGNHFIKQNLLKAAISILDRS